MMKQTHYWLILLIISISWSCAGTSNPANAETTAPEETTEGKEPQPVATADSLKLPVKDFAGLEHLFHLDTDTTYIINFWATWCKPCVAELPYFEELGAAYANAPVKVILISLDFPKQIEKKLIPFIKKNELQSEVWVLDDPDSNTWIDKVSPQWSGAIPATLVYNQNTREFWEQSFETYEELNTIVKPFLKKL